jgi:hypothetical protein
MHLRWISSETLVGPYVDGMMNGRDGNNLGRRIQLEREIAGLANNGGPYDWSAPEAQTIFTYLMKGVTFAILS